jgi:hypothetical protein
MEKQTATEWLFDKLWDEPRDKFNWFVLLKQAEKMEKQQIIDAYAQGFIESEVMDKGAEQYYQDTFKKDLFEQYYNQTFKKD